MRLLFWAVRLYGRQRVLERSARILEKNELDPVAVSTSVAYVMGARISQKYLVRTAWDIVGIGKRALIPSGMWSGSTK